STIIFAGQVTVGGVVSWTLTVKVQVPVLPWASVEEQVTVVVPIAKVLALAGEQVTASVPSTMSLAEAVKLATVPAALVASIIILAGQVTVGGVVSWTLTVKVQVPVLPWASVEEQVTVVVPIAKVLALAGEQVTASVPSTMSLAEAVKLATVPAALVASIIILAGQVTVGGVVSSTLTVKVQVPVLPWTSVEEQVTVVIPIAKVLALAGEQVTASVPSTMSVAVAVKLAIAPAALVASTIIFAGQVTVGGVVSSTLTVKVQLPV